MPSLALVNAADKTDGITQSVEPYRDGLARLGYSVAWYQCLDYRARPPVPDGGVVVPGLGFPNRTADMGINRLWVFPRRLRGLREETIFLTDPTLARVLPPGGRVIAYVHDLRPLSPYSDRISTRMMFRAVLPRLRRLPRIVVPSSFVSGELVDQGFDPARVRVVPETHRLGHHPEHVGRSLERVTQNREIRVLYVGTDRPYKNLELVVRLAQKMRGRGDHAYRFTLVSRLREHTRRRIAGLGVPGLQVFANVDSIGAVYEEHDVLVFPSRYEGFGRPLIEAMAYGLPILASDIPPAREVVGDGGLLLDPDDLEGWVQALSSVGEAGRLEPLARRSLQRGRAYLPDRFEVELSRAFAAS